MHFIISLFTSYLARVPHHCKTLIKRHILPHHKSKKNITDEVKSASQNIISHVTVKQYMEEAVHS